MDIHFVMNLLFKSYQGSIIQTGRLGLKERKHFILSFVRHLIVGGIGTLFYIAGLAFLVEILNWNPVISTILSFLTLVILTYLFNHFWVYRSSRKHSYSAPRFAVVCTIGLILNAGIMYSVVEFLEWWYIWGIVVATMVVPLTNFLLNFYWAFKGTTGNGLARV
jgi:putative flippase GtrA